MQSSPFPRYLVPPRSKYSPQHHILKHPQLPFLPQCQRPSFLHKYNKLNTVASCWTNIKLGFAVFTRSFVECIDDGRPKVLMVSGWSLIGHLSLPIELGVSREYIGTWTPHDTLMSPTSDCDGKPFDFRSDMIRRARLRVHPFSHPSIRPPVLPSVHPSVHPSIHPPTHLPTYLPTLSNCKQVSFSKRTVLHEVSK